MFTVAVRDNFLSISVRCLNSLLIIIVLITLISVSRHKTNYKLRLINTRVLFAENERNKQELVEYFVTTHKMFTMTLKSQWKDYEI